AALRIFLCMKLELTHDLQNCASRKLGDADRSACVSAVFRTPQCIEQIRGAVDHCELALETGCRIDHSIKTDHALHSIESADFSLDRSHHRERNGFRAEISLFLAHF